MFKKDKLLGNLEYALGITLLISIFVFIYLQMSQELSDPDIWLHLKTGEYIVQNKAVPRADIFSAPASGREWIDHSWLVQVIFYLVFHLGGVDNLIFLSALLVALAFLFLFFSVYRRRQDLLLCLSILFVAVLASKIRFNIRPENFSVFFFSLYLFILTRWINNKGVFILPLVQLLWVNCHGFFILGPLVVGVFLLAEKLKKAKLLPWEWNEAEVLDKASYRNLIVVFFLICLVCFINPYGYKGALYPLSVISGSTGKGNIFYNYIQELLPTWRFLRTVAVYYLLAAASFLVFCLNFKKINFAHLLLWLIFFSISLRVNRNIIFFNFIAFLTAAGILLKGELKKSALPDKFFGKSMPLLKSAVMILLVLWLWKINYSLLSSQYYIFRENRLKSALLGITAKGYPDQAADFMAKNSHPGNIFNLFNHGSYLIYRLYPKNKVFIDGRTELYGEDFFKNYKKVLAGNKSSIEDALKEYNINTAFLSTDILNIRALLNYFFNNPAWALVYFDEDALIFAKIIPENKTLIGRFRIDLKHWQTPKADLEKLGMKKIFPGPYIKRAWIFYYLGLDEQAVNEAREALKMLPSSADAYNILARCYIKQKLFDPAFEEIRLARIYAPANRETLISLGKFYAAKDKMDEAIKAYKKLVKWYPYFSEGYYLLGQSLSQINNLKSAVKPLEKALQLEPFEAVYYRELRDVFCKQGNLKAAEGVYQKALNLGLDRENLGKGN